MKVLITDRIANEGVEALRSQVRVDVKPGISPEELIDTIGDYEALVVRSQTQVTAPVIEAGKKLLVIGRAGVGVDNIDIEAATRRGILVVNAPTGNTISAAEHAIALMLSMARHIPQASTLLKSGVWKRSTFIGTEIKGKTLGIIGLGNVGSEVARRALGLQMQVIAHDPFISADYAGNLGVELVSLRKLLQESDFITLHSILTEKTKHLIGVKELALLKPTACIINTARGGLIDEKALRQALDEGRVAGAAIDVFPREPATDNILVGSDKVISTPHLGASTVEAQTGVAVDVAEQIISVLNGRQARHVVNAPLVSPETESAISPFLRIATIVGGLLAQLSEGQMSSIEISYQGELANYDTSALKAATIGGLLESVSEERVNIVNANIIAQSRGLKIMEQKNTSCENYASLITAQLKTDLGTTAVGGTMMRGEPHIVRVNDYWLDLMPSGGYLLFIDHMDRPGFIGEVGTITGNASINISSMHLSRLKPQGRAILVLELDEPLDEQGLQQIEAIRDVCTARLAKL